MSLLDRYSTYIQREKNKGNIVEENDGEILMILDLHNRNKKHMDKK